MAANKQKRGSERRRRLTVIAQDPSVRDRKGVLTIELEVPYERLDPGPKGARVHVIDFDASSNTLYEPSRDGLERDPYQGVTDPERLVGDRAFHAQNSYAIVMATLARFESALGRRVPFAFAAGGSRPDAAPGRGHVMKIAPHAFAEPNAFYSRRDESLLFGYFPVDGREHVFTCLSHDVVAHETTHALLDGLRPRFTDLSSPDQAAFHEGFADIVALLSVFKNAKVVAFALGARAGRLDRSQLSAETLGRSALLGLAEEMGTAGKQISGMRGDALRRSVDVAPDRRIRERPEFGEPHRRGEILVAATMRSFLNVWARRLEPLLEQPGGVDAARVAEEGATAASHLLTMAIRALDYTPPVDLQFEDFLTAMLTADSELYPDDGKFHYRHILLDVFGSYGILPIAQGTWEAPPEVSLDRNHFDSLQRDPEEMYSFLWENWKALELHPHAYTYVASVRPCTRLDTDGFTLRETLSEYVQILDVQARELRQLGIEKPSRMPDEQRVRLYGGGALVFDEFGRLKYHIGSGVGSERQSKRLEYLWESGFFGERQGLRRMAHLHRVRAMGIASTRRERW